MSLSKLIINIQNVGSNTPPITGDYVSGLIFYNAVLPYSGWTCTQIGSVQDLQTLGVVSSSTGATANAYYQISQFFNQNPTSTLFVDFITGTTNSATTFTELINMLNVSQGSIKQYGVVMNSGGNIATDVSALQTIANTMKNTYYSPAQIIYSPNVVSFNIGSATNLNTFNASNVSVCIGSDASTYGVGNSLTTTLGYTASMIGALLGLISAASVNADVAQPITQNNISNGTEYVSVKIGNTLLSNVSPTQQDTLDTNGYIFIRQIMNVNGSYISQDKVSNLTIPAINNITGQVSYLTDSIHYERVFNKAFRAVYSDMITKLNSGIAINTQTGLMDKTTISVWENDASQTANQMVINNEISGLTVIINPNQNVLLTNQLVAVMEIVPYATIYTIVVNIGFAQNF